MSLVGTRPPTVDEWEKYELHHRRRMSIKPGITGMWQVSGRSDITDFEEVVKLDTEYIEKDHIKLITRHVWEEYMEVAEDIRHTIGNRQIYQLRKETIERIFGTAKEQHGFRYTQYVGKARMEMKAGLTFACMNLKKLAKILEKRGWNTARFLLILKKIKRKEVLKEKWCWA